MAMQRVRVFHDEKLVLAPEPGSFTAEGQSTRWSNKDLDPVRRDRKKWEWYHVGGFWIAEGFNVAQMQTISSAVALGLNPGTALVACLVGNLMVTVPVCIMGYIGAKYSVNFPVIARASFGMWGAYIAMVIRAVVCVIWYGVQCSLGGNAVRCMLEGIWPSFKTWHENSLPVSASITAPDILTFALFWIISFPFLFLSIPALRWLFLIKCAVVPLFWVALFTWALTAGNGWGPLFSIPNRITEPWTIGYAFCTTIISSISGNATFAINMADITRYARNPRSATIAQAFGLPIMITLTELLGVVVAASAQIVYGQVLWNPLTVVALFENRAGKFFAGFMFAFANISTNVAGNSIPFANDVTGMFPRYMNIRRGQILCALLGFAITPWQIQAKATRFLAFLNGYSVFLGPLVGILLSDYLLVRKCKSFNISQLYKPHGLYWYWRGINWRAPVALLTGCAPLLPGLAHAINPELKMSMGILEYYSLSWLDGLVVGGLTYYLLYLAAPFETQTDEEDTGIETIEGMSADGSGDNGEKGVNWSQVKL
jgi:NCS1 family nucleobase:cation symporter-1